MQPYFFPYLGYWQLIKAVDRYIVYDDVAFIKGGWISRNNILLNGQKHLITLPLDNPSSFKNINMIAITENQQAKNKIIRTIKAAYEKAPYYSTVMPMLEQLLYSNNNIAMLNYNSILTIDNYLGIDTEVILSSSLDKNNSLKGEEKVLHINNLLGSDTYYNAIGGQDLYDKTVFAEHGIDLKFLKMNDIQYKQYKNEFVPMLSIIDALMFNSIESMRELLDAYILV